MNWKNEALDKLKRLAVMRNALGTIPEELERLELEAQGLRSSGDMKLKVAGNGKREDALLTNLMQRQELQNVLLYTQSWVAGVEGALDMLEPEERLVLERMFIYPRKGRSIDGLCTELSVEPSSVYRKRDRALRQFTLAMYGCEESG